MLPLHARQHAPRPDCLPEARGAARRRQARGKIRRLKIRILITSRQRAVRYDHARLLGIVGAAVPMCMEVASKLGGPLADLENIEFAVVGNRAMARVHREFLDLRGPTDVITFPYGEILVCAPVADSRAKEFGHDVTTELALYCIHGLLHLSGHDDLEPGPAQRMAQEQERILRSALALANA